ncbi:FkbM family methyltransferase [Methylomonas sp. CM2]|uniref:FkbM family methyltransferase n=1 Tax=Methylomonas sp. CM2 TaxID=3417647 RepID=UPI003CF9E519
MSDFWTRAADLRTDQQPLVSRFQAAFSTGIVVYGAGFVGTWAVQYLQGLGAKVVCVADRNPEKWHTAIRGVPVVAPEHPSVAETGWVLVAARHAAKAVVEQLTATGLTALSFDAFFAVSRYPDILEINEAFLADELSRQTLGAVVLAWLSGSPAPCRDVQAPDQYFCLPGFADDDRHIFIDAGAYVGDTVEKFIWACHGAFKRIHAFEPGERQFAALRRRTERLTAEWALDDGQIALVNAGVAEASGRMACVNVSGPAQSLNLVATAADRDDLPTSAVYSLDDYLQGEPATLIKADVEGLEMALLRGAAATIRRYGPKMALSVYHFPSDIFEIPAYVRSLDSSYRFALRHHSPLLMETVLYCWKD